MAFSDTLKSNGVIAWHPIMPSQRSAESTRRLRSRMSRRKRDRDDEKYWFTKYEELQSKYSELESSMEKQGKEAADAIKQLTHTIEGRGKEIQRLTEKISDLQPLYKFKDYLEEYASLSDETWTISVGGYKSGQTARDIRVAEVTLGKAMITFIDPVPDKKDFVSEEAYFDALEEYLTAMKDVRETHKKLIEYERKFPAMMALVNQVKGTE